MERITQLVGDESEALHGMLFAVLALYVLPTGDRTCDAVIERLV